MTLSTFQLGLLGVLTFQSTVLTLAQRYSRGILRESYDKMGLILLAELLKFFFSLLVCLMCAPQPLQMTHQTVTDGSDDEEVGGRDAIMSRPGLAASMRGKIQGLLATSAPMLFQACIYLCQNSLALFALERVDAATFTLVSQGKLVSTAIFSFPILGKRFSSSQWQAIFSLSLAVVMVCHSKMEALSAAVECSVDEQPKQLGLHVDTKMGASAQAANATVTNVIADVADYSVGVGAALVNVALSGFSTCFMELVFKGSQQSRTLSISIWERNLQLSFFSIIANVFAAQWSSAALPPGQAIQSLTKSGVVCAVLLASGGIWVALTLKYTDGVLKNIAVTLTIICTPIFEALVLGEHLSLYVAIGAALIIIAVKDYNYAPASKS